MYFPIVRKPYVQFTQMRILWINIYVSVCACMCFMWWPLCFMISNSSGTLFIAVIFHNFVYHCNQDSNIRCKEFSLGIHKRITLASVSSLVYSFQLHQCIFLLSIYVCICLHVKKCIYLRMCAVYMFVNRYMLVYEVFLQS